MGSVDIENSIFQWEKPQYFRDVSIDSYDYFKLYSKGGFNANNSGSFPNQAQSEFNFHLSDLNNYYLPSRSFFRLQLTVNTAFNTDDSTFESDIRGIWNRCQLLLNSTVVEDVTSNFQEKCKIDSKFWTKQYSHEIGGDLGYFPHSNSQSDGSMYGASTALLANKAMGAPALQYDYALWCDEADTKYGKRVAPAVGKEPFPANYWETRVNTFGRRLMLSHQNVNGGNTQAKSAGGTVNPLTPEEILALNTGLTMNFWIPCYELFQFFKYFDRVTKGVDIQINLFKNPDLRTIERGADGVLKPSQVITGMPPAETAFLSQGSGYMNWVGSGVEWWIPYIKPSIGMEAQLNRVLEKGVELPITFESGLVYNQILQTQGTANWRITTTSSRPTRLIYGTRATAWDTAGFNQGAYKDSFFTSARYTDWSVYLNGKKIPNATIQVQYRQARYTSFNVMELYNRYLAMCYNFNSPAMRNYGLGAGNLDYSDFATWYMITCIDLTPGNVGEIGTSQSELVLEYGPGEAGLPDTTIYALLYVERTVMMNLSSQSTYISIK